jgi:hypothetical protein
MSTPIESRPEATPQRAWFHRRREERRRPTMDYRCVETDPTKQELLEIYCAAVLATEHNDFDNH